MKAPLLLAIPQVLFKAMRDEGNPLIPHEVWGLSIKIINKSANAGLATTN